MREVLAERTLLGLPATEWARRFQRGSVRLVGRASEARLPAGGHVLSVDGPTAVLADFLGGAVPTLVRLEVEGDLRLGERAGRTLRLQDQRIFLDGLEVPAGEGPIGSGQLLAELVLRLGDVDVHGHALPDGDLVLALGGGIEVHVGRGVRMTIRGAARGPADDLRLCQPLEIGFGGDGLRLSHNHLRWINRLARVRLERATLHPDGSVRLSGAGRRAVDVAVRGSLRTASAALSGLVRATPGVRRYLAVP